MNTVIPDSFSLWLRSGSGRPSVGAEREPGSEARGDSLSQGPWRVWLHNDSVTPMDYVVNALRTFFALGGYTATGLMLKAHFLGCAEVGQFSSLDARTRVGAAHARAREDAWPLHFSCEPTA